MATNVLTIKSLENGMECLVDGTKRSGGIVGGWKVWCGDWSVETKLLNIKKVDMGEGFSTDKLNRVVTIEAFREKKGVTDLGS